jgi:hypothetical protein
MRRLLGRGLLPVNGQRWKAAAAVGPGIRPQEEAAISVHLRLASGVDNLVGLVEGLAQLSYGPRQRRGMSVDVTEAWHVDGCDRGGACRWM